LDPSSNLIFLHHSQAILNIESCLILKVEKKPKLLFESNFGPKHKLGFFPTINKQFSTPKIFHFSKKKTNLELMLGSKFELDHHLGFFPTIIEQLLALRIAHFSKIKNPKLLLGSNFGPKHHHVFFPTIVEQLSTSKVVHFSKKEKIKALPMVQFWTKAIA
jgi:hypothetical protein